MIQVIEQTDPLASIGQSAGTGLSTGLEMLINQKVKDMQKEKLIKMGLSPILLDLPPALAGPIAKQQMAQKGLLDFLKLGEEPPPVEGAPPQQVPPVEVAPTVEGVPPTTVPRATGLKRLSDEDLVISAGQGGNVGEIAKAELLRRSQMEKGEARREERKADRHSRVSDEVFKRADKIAAEIPQKNAALQGMELAVKEGNVGFFSRDNLAELTGVEGFRSPEGAIFLTASKEYFLGSLKRAGARPNQWIEKQIQKMLPKIGRSREANLSVVEALRADLDVEKRGIELTQELGEESEEKYGYVHRNLGSQINKKLEVFANKRQKELEITLRRIIKEAAAPSKLKKTSPGMINIVLPDGRIGQVPKERLKKALELGATRQ